MRATNIWGNIRLTGQGGRAGPILTISVAVGDSLREDNTMMLALVNNERQRRQELRTIIQPLSDEFIHGSPESLPVDSYRMQTQSFDLALTRPAWQEYVGRRS